MHAFCQLFRELDETTKTSLKLAALRRYFASAPPEDAAWAVYFLSGRRLKRLFPARRLAEWCCDASGLPDWMFEECYDVVGDLAETVALLLPASSQGISEGFAEVVRERIVALRELDAEECRTRVLQTWEQMDAQQRFVWNKLITGGFRVGVSQRLVARALSEVGEIPAAVIQHRLMGPWEPTGEFYRGLFREDTADADASRPYPFFLAHPLSAVPESLGEVADWQIEWKWDGIRTQLIRRGGTTHLWSRGEEPILHQFPELEALGEKLPEGTVLDGEIVARHDGQVLPFGELQRRLGRKKVGRKLLSEVPCSLVAFDLMELAGEDIRAWSLSERRTRLEELVAAVDDEQRLTLSQRLACRTWRDVADIRESSREHAAEGLMLKRRDSEYGVGRVSGSWWKWKVDPYSIDAVLIYAQPGHGRRASLYTDYTFAVWNEGELLPIAKAYSGLTDEEIRQVDRYIREHTIERFGPVRSVTPSLVFELHFEDIRESTRHKSGIAVRFPRMARWRTDKEASEADTLETVRALLRGRD